MSTERKPTWQETIANRDWRGVKIITRWHWVNDLNKVPHQIIFSERYCNTNGYTFLFDYAKFGTIHPDLCNKSPYCDTIRLYFEDGDYDEWYRDIANDEYAPWKLVKEAQIIK